MYMYIDLKFLCCHRLTEDLSNEHVAPTSIQFLSSFGKQTKKIKKINLNNIEKGNKKLCFLITIIT